MATDSITYGKRQGSDRNITAVPITNGEVLKQAGGGFVTISSGKFLIATASSTTLNGYCLAQFNFTGTSANEVFPVDKSIDSVYELPLGSASTWADTNIGGTYDLIIESSVQKVDLTASSKNHVVVVGKGYTNAAGTVLSALVKPNPAKWA